MTTPRFPLPARVVIKVGSSSLRTPEGHLDTELVGRLVEQMVTVRRAGVELVLVSSGAVAAGLGAMGLSRRPNDLGSLQAAASIGQGLLMRAYQERFSQHSMICGQVLLTPQDVVDRARYLNARTTFETLLNLGAVPIVNENDTVATDELRFGDNDRLAALVTSMLGAQLLVLLSDVEGLLDGDPSRGRPLPVIERVDDLSTLSPHHRGGSGTDVGSGGMASKLEAARIATFSAAHAIIASARRDQVIVDAVHGRPLGTWFPPAASRPESRKLWIAFAPQPQGALWVDQGAVRALVERGSSLLAAGVVDVAGSFVAGDAVDVLDLDDRLIARGLVGYSAVDVRRLRGRSTSALVDELGPGYDRSVIHRDRLVVLC